MMYVPFFPTQVPPLEKFHNSDFANFNTIDFCAFVSTLFKPKTDDFMVMSIHYVQI